MHQMADQSIIQLGLLDCSLAKDDIFMLEKPGKRLGWEPEQKKKKKKNETRINSNRDYDILEMQ